MKKTHWQERHAEKIATPDDAVAKVRPGNRVFIGSGAGEPQTLVEALSPAHRPERHGDRPLPDPRGRDLRRAASGQRFRHNAFFIGPNVREAVNEGRADYTPILLSEIPASSARAAS